MMIIINWWRNHQLLFVIQWNQAIMYSCKTIFEYELINKWSITTVFYDNVQYHKHIIWLQIDTEIDSCSIK